MPCSGFLETWHVKKGIIYYSRVLVNYSNKIHFSSLITNHLRGYYVLLGTVLTVRYYIHRGMGKNTLSKNKYT